MVVFTANKQDPRGPPFASPLTRWQFISRVSSHSSHKEGAVDSCNLWCCIGISFCTEDAVEISHLFQWFTSVDVVSEARRGIFLYVVVTNPSDDRNGSSLLRATVEHRRGSHCGMEGVRDHGGGPLGIFCSLQHGVCDAPAV